MKPLTLYSTVACHLCELALEEITPCLQQQPDQWSLEEVDITRDPELLKAYGTRIPVLYASDNQEHLYWPFDQQQVSLFLSKLK